MSSAIYPDPPRLVTAVCGHGEQQRLSNARLRLTFYNAPVAYCGPARPGSAFQQSAVSGLLPRARARRRIPDLSCTDRDTAYGLVFRQRLRAMGIRDKPTAPRSPWQNPYVERLIGTIRRECLDHMIVFGEAHLRRILGRYATYYNESRVHRSLDKDAPFHRAIERFGVITSRPVLGGLHHQYCRI